MPRARTTERLARAHSSACGCVCAIVTALAWPAAQAQAQPTGAGASSDATLQRALELARQRKGRALEADARKLLDPAPTAAEAALAPPPAAPLPALSGQAPVHAASLGTGAARATLAPPRLWSLTALGDEVSAEVLYEGRIHRVEGADRVVFGPWTVLSLDSRRLVLQRKASAPARSRAGGTAGGALLELRPPARGSSMESFFHASEAPSTVLSDAAAAAAQLPLPPAAR